jgi:hypothetical protein
VVELVDTRDLKSLSLGYAGSIPAVRTMLKSLVFLAYVKVMATR